MNLEFKTYCGVSYIVPEGFVFDYTNISAYKDYWGAGDGWQEKLVPERIGGRKVSHIWHIHDESWSKANSSFKDFMIGNAMFLFNFCVYLFDSDSKIKTVWQSTKAFGYILAVSTFGWKVFKKLKRWENGLSSVW